MRASKAIFIAVGTPPTEQGEADLSYVESVARSVSGAINGYKVVVEKSTVPVYTSDWVRKIILRNAAPPDSFDVASNPEFLREGTAVTDFLYPDRIVVGADSERCAAVLREIYAPLTDGSYYQRKDAIPAPDRAQIPPPLIVTSAKSAELIKHASNAFLAMKISFINAVASICESVGANVQQVCQGIGTDSRIGPRFLNPGIGYGGSCFPKDLMAFRAVARECGYEFRLLDEVMRINEDQRQRFLRKVRTALWTLRGKRLGVLGLAFKGGTDDIRESPAILLVQSLLQEGCQIAAYDPAATARAREVLNSEHRVRERSLRSRPRRRCASDSDRVGGVRRPRSGPHLQAAEVSHRDRWPQSLRSRSHGGAWLHLLQRRPPRGNAGGPSTLRLPPPTGKLKKS